MSDWTDADCIRQWWYLYLTMWRQPGGPGQASKASTELDAVSAECERRGIIKQGKRMPRTGAEDLAGQVDDCKRRAGVS